MTSNAMTVLGAATAILGFIGPNLPDDTPSWVRLLVGALIAGAASIGGYSHPGKAQKPWPKVPTNTRRKP